MRATTCCGLLILALASFAAAEAAPQVTATVPANGDEAVDPALAELRVTFDCDMLTDRYSFVGGGPSFPEVTGQPRWEGKRECVLPVKLVPGQRYVFGVNSAQHQGFASTEGVPATPVVVEFTVAGGPELDAQANERAVETLHRAIQDRYSHRDRLGLDWDSLFAAHRDEMLGAVTPRAFAHAAAAMLASAQDRHLWLSAEGEIIGTVTELLSDPSFDFAWIRANVPGFSIESDVVFSGRYPDGIGYLLVGTWERSRAQALEAIEPVMAKLADCPALVVDMRANAGGDEDIARRLAGYFVDEPVVYAKHRWRDPEAKGGWGPVYERVLQPIAEDLRYGGPVVVLTGGRNMSSAEAFILMMRQAKRCTTIGAPSIGSSGNPGAFDLGNGVEVFVPRWQAMTADDEDFEGTGLTPEVVVEALPQREGDEVLQSALTHLRSTLKAK